MMTPLPAVHCFVRRPSLGRMRITSIRTIEGKTRFNIGSSAGVTFAAAAGGSTAGVCAKIGLALEHNAMATMTILRAPALRLSEKFMGCNLRFTGQRASRRMTQAAKHFLDAL